MIIATEHFWKLIPAPVLTGATHTLVEVVHSSNREHRHGLKSDSVPGYYLYLWPVTIPDNGGIPADFDELHSRSAGDRYMGFLLRGRTFKQKDFSSAVEKSLLFMEKIEQLYSAEELCKGVQ